MMGFDTGLLLFYIGTFITLFLGMFYLITFFENRDRLEDPKMKRFPTLSILVPAFNESETIAKTIRSLIALSYPDNKKQIIVIDDGSSDETYAIAKSFPEVTALRQENGGKGKALNLGLQHATGELVAVMDADSFVTKGALRAMIGHFRNDNIMAVTPTLKVHKPKSFLQRIQYVEYLFSVLFRKIFAYLDSVYVTPGPFSIYRKVFFDRHGGFDEHNITEDMEVAFRIQSLGYDIENSLNAEVFTVTPSNLWVLLRQRVRWYTGMIENLWQYRRLFGPKTGNLGVFVLPMAVISVVIVLAYLVYYGVLFGQLVASSIHQLWLVDLDFALATSGSLVGFSPVQWVNPVSILILTLVVFTVILFGLAKLYSKDKEKDVGVNLIIYVLTYGPIFSLFWLTTIAYKLMQVKVRW